MRCTPVSATGQHFCANVLRRISIATGAAGPVTSIERYDGAVLENQIARQDEPRGVGVAVRRLRPLLPA